MCSSTGVLQFQEAAPLGPCETTAIALTMHTLSPHPINVMSQPDNNVMMIKMILIEIANGAHYHYS